MKSIFKNHIVIKKRHIPLILLWWFLAFHVVGPTIRMELLDERLEQELLP